MELRVWTGLVERVILNADEETTCRDVIFALAAVTQIAGCYTLIGQQVDTYLEFLLTPSDRPLKLVGDRKRLGQPPVRFLLRHSNRSQPITQLTYHERTRNKSNRNAAKFLYNREASWSQVRYLRRRHTDVGIPGWWRRLVKQLKILDNYDIRAISSGFKNAPPVDSHKNATYFGKIEPSVRTSNRQETASVGSQAEVSLVRDKNNNNSQQQKSISREVKSDPIELILYITEASASAGTNRSLSSSAPMSKSFRTTTTLSAESASKPSYSNHSSKETIELNKELNHIYENNDRKLAGIRRDKEMTAVNKNLLHTQTNSRDSKYVGDSLERMVVDNTFAESDIHVDKKDSSLPLALKQNRVELKNRKSSGQSSSTDPSIDKTYIDVIESLDDFLDQEGKDQAKRIPKKLAINSGNVSTEGVEGELTYKQKLNKFRMLEREDKSSDESSTAGLQKNSTFEDEITKMNSEYAEHVDSEIKDLKIEVEKNEIAAKQLQSSVKQMQKNFDFYENRNHSRSYETVNKSMNYFFYPTEQFSTLAKNKKEGSPKNVIESDNENVFENETEANRSIVESDSLNQEFLILLEDNRKGFLV